MAIPFSATINGTERIEYIRPGAPVGPGITIERQSSGRSLATFTTLDRDGVYAPVVGQTVSISDVSQSPEVALFVGVVDRVVKRVIEGTTALECQVSCVDYACYCDRRIVSGVFTMGDYGSIVAIAEQLMIDTGLDDLGVTVSSNSAGASILDTTFNFITLTEALNQLARVGNCEWTIGPDKVFTFYRITGGGDSAPEDITDSPANYVRLSVQTQLTKFANRVYAKSTRDLASAWVDTYTGDGVLTTFLTRIMLTEKPVVTVDGVVQTVVELAQIGTDPYQWYYIDHGVGLFQNLLDPPITGDISIRYPSPLPYVAIAEDAASIASDGLSEALLEPKDISTKAALQAYADGELARLVEQPVELEILTRVNGYAPGQVVHVTESVTAIDDDFVITSVTSREIGQTHFEHTLRATSSTVQPTRTPQSYFGGLIAATRLPAARDIESVTFILAGTIEGLTNPGLTEGVKTASKAAQRDGVIKDVTCVWDTPPYLTDVEIDILKNGVSIFTATSPPQVFVYPSTETGLVRFWEFTSDVIVTKGDIFTIEVLVADATAMDGTLQICIA